LVAGRRDWLPYVIYFILACAILGPLLAHGYILTLDMAFAPNMGFDTQLYGLEGGPLAAAPLFLLLQLVSKIAPMWLIQKIILFLIFFAAALGAHRLFPIKGAGRYFVGMLYTLNPFTYIRFITGQWMILAAYAVVPFAIKAFLSLLEEGGIRNTVKVALLATLTAALSTHILFMLFLAFLIIFLARMVKERRKPANILKAIKALALAGGMFILLNLYWLILLFMEGMAIVSQFGETDLYVFAPIATSSFGVTFDVASMHGFWRGGYIYTQDILTFWWLLLLLLLFLATYGFIGNCFDNRQRWVSIPFATLGFIGFFLALGMASSMTRPLFTWLYNNVPFFIAFRDSQIFVALLCLCYAYLGGFTVNELAQKLRKQMRRPIRIGVGVILIIVLLTPSLYSLPIFGLWGQVKATDYPREWYEVNNYLNQDEDDFNVLFLPWHLYADYNWLPNKDRRLGNPAGKFFDKPVIRGDNVELPGVYSTSTNPISRYVEFLLSKRSGINNLGELLSPLNIKYVILAHEVDYESYDFLYQQEDLSVELAKSGLTLFKNEHPVSRAYAGDSIIYIKDLGEYLELSKTQDVMEHLYLIGEGASYTNSTEMQQLNVVQKSPVRYQVDGIKGQWIVFTVPQNVSTEYWEFNGQKSLKNLGFMPAFASAEEEGDITYTRFKRVYLPGYIVSAMVLVTLILAYLGRRKIGRLIPYYHRKKDD